MSYQVFAGDTFTAKIDFNEELGVAPIPNPGYPTVTIKQDSSVLSSSLASVTSNPDVYETDLTVPNNVFDFSSVDYVDLKVVWKLVNTDGSNYVLNQVLRVIPNEEEKLIVEDIFILEQSDTIGITVPLSLIEGIDTACLNVYNSNTKLNLSTITPYDWRLRGDSTDLFYKIPSSIKLLARLEHYNLIVTGVKDSKRYNPRHLRMYFVTPSILAASSMVEDYLHKSRQHSVIPQLDYTQTDLIHYLQRGLDMYNGYPPVITDFNGSNMLGTAREGWLICSSYYALSAQYLAEGDLAFNYSGPGVTFDVDRTGFIESAIGRLDSALDRQIRTGKQLLGKRGLISGDGDTSGVSNGTGMGVTSLSNTSLTRWRNGYNDRYIRRF